MSNAFIGCPTYDGRIEYGTARALYQQASKGDNPHIIHVKTGSLLAANCNHLYCMALNLRDKHNLKWFALLHSDVIPEPYWLDKLVSIANQVGAHMLSAVIPIKDDKGVTSTAIDDPDDCFWPITRLTMRQVWHETMPDTFSIDVVAKVLRNMEHIGIADLPESRLLVNTGCMIVRIDMKWSSDLRFTIYDKILWNKAERSYQAACEPEDWNFSRQVAQHFGIVCATRAVRCYHAGSKYWDSHARDFGVGVDPKLKPAELWI